MIRISFLCLTLILGVHSAQAAPDCPSSIPAAGSFSLPVPIHCADLGTMGVMAPNLFDFSHKLTYLGSPSFLTHTKDENWKKSIFADGRKERIERLNAAGHGNRALKELALESLLNLASLKTAQSREEFDQVVHARCLLFVSSAVCEGAAEAKQLIQCEGSAEKLASGASEQSGDAEKVKVILEVVKEIGVEHISYAVVFAALKYLVPSLVEPISKVLMGKYYYEEARNKIKQVREVKEIEGSTWFAAFMKNQKNRELETLCYPGALQFKQRVSEVLWGLKLAYDEMAEQ